jgi:poly-gamma-glutamate capsule biosynthesis protein CapA/YwtB (metallophosphatase superfamily)
MTSKTKKFTAYSVVMAMWLLGMSLPVLAIMAKGDQVPLLTAHTSEAASADYVVISSAGDCTLGIDERFGTSGTLPAVLADNNDDYSYFFSNIVSIFQNDDFSTVNLEGPLTNSVSHVDKPFVFRGNMKNAAILKAGNIKSVNLANNHSYDYGEDGIADTKTALDQQGISYFGDRTVLVKTLKGHQFGFLGYSGFSYDEDFLTELHQDIEALKSQGCIVIINFHWGDEKATHSNPIQQQLAHYAVDYGADLILGHHPHVLQDVEQYKGKLICYSLGNFVFGGNINPNDKDTMIVQSRFEFAGNKLTAYGLRFIPCSISTVNYLNDYRPTLQRGTEKDRILHKLNDRSPQAGFLLSDEFTMITVTEP